MQTPFLGLLMRFSSSLQNSKPTKWFTGKKSPQICAWPDTLA